jgi:exopolysaccharide biosynthesis polyprenyl glycosylphosphotransferase
VTSAGCQLFSLPQAFSKGAIEPTLEWRRGVPLLGLTRPGLRGQQLVMKRAVDIVASAAGLMVLAPVFAMVGLAVKLSSPGPVLFSQMRVGLGGRRFRILKFRSMVVGAEHKLADLADHNICTDPRLFKIKDDPRATRLGRFLRQSSIDELPQLWNVLRGDMSLVGPRPPLPSEVALYQEHHYSRFDMRPGVTGPWQVSGRNRITDFDEVIRLERAYMRHWSIWKDLAILARTIPVVLRMDGAH